MRTTHEIEMLCPQCRRKRPGPADLIFRWLALFVILAGVVLAIDGRDLGSNDVAVIMIGSALAGAIAGAAIAAYRDTRHRH